MPSRCRWPRLTRRDFLSGMAAGALLGPRSAGLRFSEAAQYPFEEILAVRSGIHWVHSNGKSPEKYLPETTGAGCAFFHYDNDGWMDIYLVNSGKCDFAGRAAAQRTLQKQPGWHLYRRHRESGSGRWRIRPGRSGGRL